MIVTCTVCKKVLEEGRISLSVEEHYEKLAGRMARHLKVMHPDILVGEIGKAQANFVALLVHQYYDSEDAWYLKKKEELRELVTSEVEADFDEFFLGAVAVCHYLKTWCDEKTMTGEMLKRIVSGQLRGELMERFGVEERDVAEYGKGLLEYEEEEEEEEDDEDGEDEGEVIEGVKSNE